MKMKRILASICAATLVACTQTVEKIDVKTLNGMWSITEIEGVQISDSIPAEMQIDIDDQSFSANGGCNSMNGTFDMSNTSNPNAIMFMVKASTKMMCPDMDNETRLQNALANIAVFTVDTIDNRRAVSFLDATGKSLLKMMFIKNGEAQEWSVKGEWKVIAIDGEVINTTETSPSLNLDLDNGMMSGNAGCNSIGGELQMDDCSISFGNVYATKMMCDDYSMSVEDKFLKVVNEVVGWSVENGELHLTDKEGKVALSLVRD